MNTTGVGTGPRYGRSTLPDGASCRTNSAASHSAPNTSSPVTRYWPKPMSDQMKLVGVRSSDASAVSARSTASARRRSASAGAASEATAGRSATGTEGSALASRSRTGSIAGASEPAYRDARLRSNPARDDALRLQAGVEPTADLVDAAGTLARPRDRDGGVGEAVARELRAHVVAHARHVFGSKEIGPVQDDEL